jgi:orotidine-5'-phosphate decarboxylase
MTATFIDRLHASWKRTDSMLCVGLDPSPDRYPTPLKDDSDRAFLFCRDIVDATADHCSAFKPQFAYFAAQRAEPSLERLCTYIRETYPSHVLILDAKRGDIGPTAQQYAVEAFDRYGADAVTVNPYLGFDSIEPFLAWADRGVIVLCRTSNAGGTDLQGLAVSTAIAHAGGQLLYQHVATLCAGPWNTTGQLAMVVGATFPAELSQVRSIAPKMPLLVPGIGAQGGDIEATVTAGRTADGFGMIINSSRAILYADSGPEFANAAARAAEATTQALRAVR